MTVQERKYIASPIRGGMKQKKDLLFAKQVFLIYGRNGCD